MKKNAISLEIPNSADRLTAIFCGRGKTYISEVSRKVLGKFFN